MRATALEFRLRMLINAVIIFLGFFAPWDSSSGKHQSLLEWLATEVSRAGMLSFSRAVPVTLILASILAAIAVLLRVWGTACLGPVTVTAMRMQAGVVVADGPYCFVRNPLYLGLWFMTAALAFLMPPSGALFTIVLISIFLVRLTLGEEAFLAERLGEPYHAYLRAVPRFLPRLRSRLPRGGARPQWLRSTLSELTPIGVFVALAFCSWTYNGTLMIRVVLISLGLSLITRALMPRSVTETTTAA